MSRTQWTLVTVLVVQVLLIAVCRSPFSGAAGSTETTRLFPGLEGVDAARMMLSGADEESRLELVRREGVWIVPELQGFPADALKISDLLDTLASLEVQRPIVGTSRYHASFQVEDDAHESRVRVFAEGSEGDDSPVADLILGSSSNYRTTHARRAGDDRVWEIRGLSAWEVRPDTRTWVRPELVTLDASEVVGLRIDNPSGGVELERDGEGWTTGGVAIADASAVDSLVRTAADLRFAEVTGLADDAAQGFDDPTATIELRLEGQSVNILLGHNSDESNSQRFVRVVGSEFAGTLWESTAQRFLEANSESFKAGS